MTAAPWGRRAAPATPHLIAAVVVGLVAGLTTPLLLIGLARHTGDGVSPLLAGPVVLGWAMAVVAIMNSVLPWRRLVVAGVRHDRRALIAAQATRSEQTDYHTRWLLEASAWALALSLPAVLVTVAVVAVALGSPVVPRLVGGALGTVLGVGLAGASTARLLRDDRSA